MRISSILIIVTLFLLFAQVAAPACADTVTDSGCILDNPHDRIFRPMAYADPYPEDGKCIKCDGRKTCWTCWGTGKNSSDEACFSCNGTGRCFYCGGTGRK